MIDGVKIVPLRQIPDERGKVMHMLRADAEHFSGFGEIYFSMVYPGAVKAWHLHRRMTLNYAVPIGRADFQPYRHIRRYDRSSLGWVNRTGSPENWANTAVLKWFGPDPWMFAKSHAGRLSTAPATPRPALAELRPGAARARPGSRTFRTRSPTDP